MLISSVLTTRLWFTLICVRLQKSIRETTYNNPILTEIDPVDKSSRHKVLIPQWQIEANPLVYPTLLLAG